MLPPDGIRHFVFSVEDIEDALERLRPHGGTLVGELAGVAGISGGQIPWLYGNSLPFPEQHVEASQALSRPAASRGLADQPSTG